MERVQTPTLPLTGCVTLGESLHLCFHILGGFFGQPSDTVCSLVVKSKDQDQAGWVQILGQTHSPDCVTC